MNCFLLVCMKTIYYINLQHNRTYRNEKINHKIVNQNGNENYPVLCCTFCLVLMSLMAMQHIQLCACFIHSTILSAIARVSKLDTNSALAIINGVLVAIARFEDVVAGVLLSRGGVVACVH